MSTNPTESRSTQEQHSIEIEGGLTYNSDKLSIEGSYSDELSQHRAKKTWCSVLETDFLLIPDSDFQFELQKNHEQGQFQIACTFKSACGRYAFWRLINEQAPEVQFLLETAHIAHRYNDYSGIISNLEKSITKRELSLLGSLKKMITDTVEVIRKLRK
jgi:hypothetical protein